MATVVLQPMLFLLLGCIFPLTGAMSVLDTVDITKQQARELLQRRVAQAHSGDTEMSLLQGELRTTFASLPRDAFGNLGHQAVRYLMHRHFVHKHGWYVLGLEPTVEHGDNEWIPSFLQDVLEMQADGHGTSLADLAALTATVKDIIDREAAETIGSAMQANGVEVKDGATLSRSQLLAVLADVYIVFLWNGRGKPTPDDVLTVRSSFHEKYKGVKPAFEWFNHTALPRIDAIARSGREATVEDAQDIVRVIVETYHTLNDQECNDLRSQMVEIEGKRPGHVRLSHFYQTALYSHWSFSESPSYLRTLGALDEESDPSSPHVILPNYVMARTNCLESSSLYSICCRNECEDFMGDLESEFGGSPAPPDRLLASTSKLTSATVKAPRDISPSLRKRLQEIAHMHGGSVPLHGRLFAEWMHHAFPRECPFPHASGTTSPLTPDEWMESHSGEKTVMSREEMQQTIDADTCKSGFGGTLPSPSDCGGSDSDTEWSQNEDRKALLHPHHHAAVEARRLRPAGVLPLEPKTSPAWRTAACLLAAGLLACSPWGKAVLLPQVCDKLGHPVPLPRVQTRAIASLAVAMVGSYLCGLLNFGVLALSAVGSGVALVTAARRRHLAYGSSKKDCDFGDEV